MISSQYINEMRREYALYVLQSRSIPAITDGLKAAGRRALWTARDGKKTKTATLAGATMPIHPHSECSGAINTLAAPYGNNIPYFKGEGAFGTLLNPTAYGASRYTSVQVSTFTRDVIFADMDIVPLKDNYDGTIEEPVHFLPLVPLVLLNPIEGVAVGYATNILPRSLDDLIIRQIAYLTGSQQLSDPLPKFLPTKSEAIKCEQGARGRTYLFEGEIQIKDTSTAVITRLPYSQTHDTLISKLTSLLEEGVLRDYVDHSKKTISVVLKFERGFLKDKTSTDLLKLLGLITKFTENLNVLDFTGQAVMNVTEPARLIVDFTEWRLGWYVKRYERLKHQLEHEIRRYLDIKKAIEAGVGKRSHETASRSDLVNFLTTIDIVNVDFIADLSVYRFTNEEYHKNELKLKEATEVLNQYNKILKSEDERKQIYIKELQDVLKKYNDGKYATETLA